MRRKVTELIEEAKSKMSGYAALLGYRLMNLCVQAEPAALLSIEITDGDATIGLEHLASCYRPDDYHFMIAPHKNSFLKEIGKAVAKTHPEFKQEIKISDKDQDADGNDLQYLYLTMPDVDEDRKKLMNDSVDLLCEDCKTRIDGVKDTVRIKIEKELINASDDEKNEANETLKLVYDNVSSISQSYVVKKREEIEQAFQKYYALHNSGEDKKDDINHNLNSGKSMKLFGYEDDE